MARYDDTPPAMETRPYPPTRDHDGVLDWEIERIREYLRWSDHNLAAHLRRLGQHADYLTPHDRTVFLLAVAERLDAAPHHEPPTGGEPA